MSGFGYEIDFLPVGGGERSGDAIALRYGEEGNYTIQVVDGGDLDAGETLAKHIRKYYGNPNFIDHIVLTHADDDHSSGLRKVIEEFDVGGIWMNRPWLYADEIVDLFRDQRWTVDGLKKRLRDDFPILAEIEDMAEERDIPIYEAFQGEQFGQFCIMAPSRERYLQLIPQFSRTPEAAERATETLGIAGFFSEAAKRAAEWIGETWGYETLEEDPETSASNESSVVQLASLDDRLVLLTGDAGVASLAEAADYADRIGVRLPGLRFMQVPHHGSRHNISPSELNRWLGEPLGQGETRNSTAFVSVAGGDDKRPRKKVVNAFIRRGASVHVTRGGAKRHRHNMEDRAGWSSSTPLAFSDQVEA